MKFLTKTTIIGNNEESTQNKTVNVNTQNSLNVNVANGRTAFGGIFLENDK